jgi:glycosyltransferase involved in cell wall biosynthesis
VLGETHDPGHYAELRSLVRSLHLDDNVRFLGGLEDVYPVLERSDIFCVLSRSEGFSNALLEAMACGLPCVATRVGGNPELVRDEVNGFLVESEDDAAAARRLMELMANPGKARAMGRRSRLLVEEQFTTERMVEALVRSYESLLDRR